MNKYRIRRAINLKSWINPAKLRNGGSVRIRRSLYYQIDRVIGLLHLVAENNLKENRLGRLAPWSLNNSLTLQDKVLEIHAKKFPGLYLDDSVSQMTHPRRILKIRRNLLKKDHYSSCVKLLEKMKISDVYQMQSDKNLTKQRSIFRIKKEGSNSSVNSWLGRKLLKYQTLVTTSKWTSSSQDFKSIIIEVLGSAVSTITIAYYQRNEKQYQCMSSYLKYWSRNMRRSVSGNARKMGKRDLIRW